MFDNLNSLEKNSPTKVKISNNLILFNNNNRINKYIQINPFSNNEVY